MKLPALITSDTHFEESPKTNYRWGLWPWLADQSRHEGVRTVLILGDLTDKKDYHPASLTNRIVKEVCALKEVVEEIVILLGNHDYLREGHAYFAFLSQIPGVRFITKPTEVMLDTGPSAYFLPHSKNPAKDWAGRDFSHYDYLFMHQTVRGAKSSNGQEMDGEELPPLNAGKVYSGDIHVPQVCGKVEYIGSPYHVHFGDKFKPRCLLLDRRNRPVDLHFETISRRAIEATCVADLKRLDLRPGDQVKVRIDLAEADAHEWSARRRAITDYLRKAEVEIHGVNLVVNRSQARFSSQGRAIPQRAKTNASDEVLRFVEANSFGAEVADLGLEIVK